MSWAAAAKRKSIEFEWKSSVTNLFLSTCVRLLSLGQIRSQGWVISNFEVVQSGGDGNHRNGIKYHLSVYIHIICMPIWSCLLEKVDSTWFLSNICKFLFLAIICHSETKVVGLTNILRSCEILVIFKEFIKSYFFFYIAKILKFWKKLHTHILLVM